MRRLAIVLFLVAACGGEKNAMPDAPVVPPDTAPDAYYEPVTLTMRTENTPVSGVHVYFQLADGTLAIEAISDAQGKVSAQLPPGGFVTAVNPYMLPMATIFDTLYTWVDVQPGDQLELTIPLVNTLTVDLTAPLSGTANVTKYYVYSTCNLVGGESITPTTGNPGGEIHLDGCGAMTDFLIVATDANSVALDFIYAPDVAVSNSATIDLTARTYTATPTRDFTFTNLPAGFGAVDVYDTVVSPRGPLARFSGVANSGSLALHVPTFTGARDVIRATSRNTTSRYSVVDWGELSFPRTTDVGARVLPEFTARPTVANHAVMWSEAATGVAPDFTSAALGVCRGTERCWDWFVVAPHASAAVPLPNLPTNLYDYNPQPSDTIKVFDLVTAKVPGGYAAVRANVFATTRPIDLINSPSGVLEYQELTP